MTQDNLFNEINSILEKLPDAQAEMSSAYRAVSSIEIKPMVASQSESSKNIFDNAVLLSLELRVFGTSRKLRNDEYEVDADKSKTGASKKLLKSEELKAIQKFDGETRRIISLYTLPSQFRSGLYVLPLASLEKIDNILRDRQEQRQSLVEQFGVAYSDLRWRDSLPAVDGGLGSLYKEADYPAESEVLAAFGMAYSYTEFSAPGKLKSISSAIYEREKEKAASVWRNAIEEGQALLRGAFASLIEHMHERLIPGADGKPKIFRDSLIQNVVDFLNTFDSRNLAGDEELAKLVKETSDMLKGVSPEDLRKSDTIKARVQARTIEIKAALDTMIADKPARKIDFQSDEWGAL